MQTKLQKMAKKGPEAHILTNPNGTEVRFVLEYPDAQVVHLCGNFNQWSPSSLRMIRRGGNGLWEKHLTLAPGRYEYKFVVDGKWTPDPNNCLEVANAFGSTNSVVEVSK
ncbi:MAG: glycogen-binding domain-containing protein [Limisphaerales bacterium]